MIICLLFEHCVVSRMKEKFNVRICCGNSKKAPIWQLFSLLDLIPSNFFLYGTSTLSRTRLSSFLMFLILLELYRQRFLFVRERRVHTSKMKRGRQTKKQSATEKPGLQHWVTHSNRKRAGSGSFWKLIITAAHLNQTENKHGWLQSNLHITLPRTFRAIQQQFQSTGAQKTTVDSSFGVPDLLEYKQFKA